jgi:N-methylhydantoinase B/oxoprolinase/acetone carboxylase alpha subunit
MQRSRCRIGIDVGGTFTDFVLADLSSGKLTRFKQASVPRDPSLSRDDERELGKLDALAVNAGDTVTFLSPGGGGFGDPFRRDVQKVLRDGRLGFVSREAALRDYRVALTERGALDAAETEK